MGLARAYSPVLHFDDINGRPLVGGKLYTYAAGTSTPATTYRNKNGTEANTNPILLNERGECVVWLNDKRSYKLVLKDALDNTIWEADSVTIPSGEGGGGGLDPDDIMDLTINFSNPTGASDVQKYNPLEEKSLNVKALRYLGGSGKQTYQSWGPISTNDGKFVSPYFWRYEDGTLDTNEGCSDLYLWIRACRSQGGIDFSVLYEKDWYDLVDLETTGTGSGEYMSKLDFRRRSGGGLYIYADAQINPNITHEWYN